MTSLDIRNNSAVMKRAEQLKRWEESDTNQQPPVPRPDRGSRIKFSSGCIFLAACLAGDKEEVLKLLEQGADINTANVDGLTALHQACIDDNLEMVEFLVEQGADINRQDNEGWTPLHATASCGFVSIARYLVEHGADVAAVNSDGDLAVDLAVDIQHLPMIDFMQKMVAEQQIDCAKARQAEQQQMLADAKKWLRSDAAEIDRPHPKTGATALHVAAAKGYTKVLSLLLAGRANVDAQDNDGWTPLHAAAHWGQKEAAQMLLDAMADMDAHNYAGQTCIDVADRKMVKYLEEYRANNKRIKRRPSSQISRISDTIENHMDKTPPKIIRVEVRPDNNKDHPNVSTSAAASTSGYSSSCSGSSGLPTNSESEETDSDLTDSTESSHSTSVSGSNEEDDKTSVQKTTNEQPATEDEAPWRRNNVARVRTSNDSPSKNQVPDVIDVNKTTTATPNAATTETTDVILRRTQSFENDEKFYQKYNELRARIKANSCPIIPATLQQQQQQLHQQQQQQQQDQHQQQQQNNNVNNNSINNNLNNNINTNNIGHNIGGSNSGSSSSGSNSTTNNIISIDSSCNTSNTTTTSNTKFTTTTSLLSPTTSHSPSSLPASASTTATHQHITPSSATAITAATSPLYSSSSPIYTVQRSASLKDHKQIYIRKSPPVSPAVSTTPAYTTNTTNTTASPAAVATPIRRSFVPPVRDEESETQRKAHAKRVRETRRSTQGVTLDEIKSAEELVKKKNSSMNNNNNNNSSSNELQGNVGKTNEATTTTMTTVMTNTPVVTATIPAATTTSTHDSKPSVEPTKDNKPQTVDDDEDVTTASFTIKAPSAGNRSRPSSLIVTAKTSTTAANEVDQLLENITANAADAEEEVSATFVMPPRKDSRTPTPTSRSQASMEAEEVETTIVIASPRRNVVEKAITDDEKDKQREEQQEAASVGDGPNKIAEDTTNESDKEEEEAGTAEEDEEEDEDEKEEDEVEETESSDNTENTTADDSGGNNEIEDGTAAHKKTEPPPSLQGNKPAVSPQPIRVQSPPSSQRAQSSERIRAAFFSPLPLTSVPTAATTTTTTITTPTLESPVRLRDKRSIFDMDNANSQTLADRLRLEANRYGFDEKRGFYSDTGSSLPPPQMSHENSSERDSSMSPLFGNLGHSSNAGGTAPTGSGYSYNSRRSLDSSSSASLPNSPFHTRDRETGGSENHAHNAGSTTSGTNADRRPSWRLKFDAGSKFKLEDANAGNTYPPTNSTIIPSAPAVIAAANSMSQRRINNVNNAISSSNTSLNSIGRPVSAPPISNLSSGINTTSSNNTTSSATTTATSSSNNQKSDDKTTDNSSTTTNTTSSSGIGSSYSARRASANTSSSASSTTALNSETSSAASAAGTTSSTATSLSNNDDKDNDKENDNRSALATQAVIQRRRKPKRRSTGVVHIDMDELDPEKQDSANDNEEKDKEKESGSENRASRSRAGSTVSVATSTSSATDDKKTRDKTESSGDNIDYKALWEAVKLENEKLRAQLKKKDDEVIQTRATLERFANATNKNSLSEIEKRERRAMERKLSELEEELKQLDAYKTENLRLKEENGALIRVISKLSK
ncbi:protein phosphatase 1 regulatory subunit 12A isoform X3 [Musca domestica]|uniref:Protein phosphatase 1 regulatory subunit 12A isoform X3 n=1 Tax=Musca domestica TaxID=7370 RepID=A0ABM3VNC4_MUSDO|nr:protein phosphatase 1 regulatory subunit 12A isoform X3 [Musca domestica]